MAVGLLHKKNKWINKWLRKEEETINILICVCVCVCKSLIYFNRKTNGNKQNNSVIPFIEPKNQTDSTLYSNKIEYGTWKYCIGRTAVGPINASQLKPAFFCHSLGLLEIFYSWFNWFFKCHHLLLFLFFLLSKLGMWVQIQTTINFANNNNFKKGRQYSLMFFFLSVFFSFLLVGLLIF